MTRSLFKIHGLVPAIVGFFSIGCLLSAWFDGLGVNLMSDAIGVAFTIFVLDVFLQQRERQRLAPVLTAAGRDAFRVAADVKRLCANALTATALPEEAHLFASGRKLSDAAFRPILDRLDVRGHSPVVQITANFNISALEYKTVIAYAQHEIAMVQEGMRSFQERYTAVADPTVISAMHNLEKVTLFAAVGVLPFAKSLPGSFWQDAAGVADDLMQALIAEDMYAADSDSDDGAMSQIAQEIERQPYRTAKAPYRPPPPAPPIS